MAIIYTVVFNNKEADNLEIISSLNESQAVEQSKDILRDMHDLQCISLAYSEEEWDEKVDTCTKLTDLMDCVKENFQPESVELYYSKTAAR